MGLVRSMSSKDVSLVGCEDAAAALTDNLYLLFNRDKIAKLKLETVAVSLDAKRSASTASRE